MTATTATALLPLRTVAGLRSGTAAGRLPVRDVVAAEELVRLHLGAHDALEDQDALRARRREALLHRLELDRQRRRRRSA